MDTVIVIRSLVPGGVAQVDGRLIPGDRLISVNDVHLESATLEQAVQALKGAPRGVVRIGVTKPLPLPEIGESSTDEPDYTVRIVRLLTYKLVRSFTLFLWRSKNRFSLLFLLKNPTRTLLLCYSFYWLKI